MKIIGVLIIVFAREALLKMWDGQYIMQNLVSPPNSVALNWSIFADTPDHNYRENLDDDIMCIFFLYRKSSEHKPQCNNKKADSDAEALETIAALEASDKSDMAYEEHLYTSAVITTTLWDRGVFIDYVRNIECALEDSTKTVTFMIITRLEFKLFTEHSRAADKLKTDPVRVLVSVTVNNGQRTYRSALMQAGAKGCYSKASAKTMIDVYNVYIFSELRDIGVKPPTIVPECVC